MQQTHSFKDVVRGALDTITSHIVNARQMGCDWKGERIRVLFSRYDKIMARWPRAWVRSET